MLIENQTTTQTDKSFDTNVSDVSFANHLFIRLVAKEKCFIKIDFKYTIFESCYLRDCKFDSCDFTGCRFIGTNFHGSQFIGCKFDYATFEKTAIDNHILDDGCPPHENLKMRFARTLRMNYQQLGDAKSVNKAIAIELEATEAHLHKAWDSRESYYRQKYTGWKRFESFIEWIKFKALDFLWGNGESTPKLLRAWSIAISAVTIIDVILSKDHQRIDSYWQALKETFFSFLGTGTTSSYPIFCLTLVLLLRFVVFSFFTAILVKRFNRR